MGTHVACGRPHRISMSSACLVVRGLFLRLRHIVAAVRSLTRAHDGAVGSAVLDVLGFSFGLQTLCAWSLETCSPEHGFEGGHASRCLACFATIADGGCRVAGGGLGWSARRRDDFAAELRIGAEGADIADARTGGSAWRRSSRTRSRRQPW